MGHQLIESDFIRVEVFVSTYVYAGVDVRYLLVVFSWGRQCLVFFVSTAISLGGEVSVSSEVERHFS